MGGQDRQDEVAGRVSSLMLAAYSSVAKIAHATGKDRTHIGRVLSGERPLSRAMASAFDHAVVKAVQSKQGPHDPDLAYREGDIWRIIEDERADAAHEVGAAPRAQGTEIASARQLRRRLFGKRPPVVRDFVERGQVDLLRESGSSAVSVVSGIGGVGKSQLASKFFRDHHQSFTYAAWVNLADQDGVPDLESIAGGLGLDWSGQDVVEVVRTVVESNANTSWLFVFDNAAGPEQVVPLIPDSDNTKVVITSRRRSWGGVAELIDLGVFQVEVAVAYLAQSAGRSKVQGAEQLAMAVGRLPLALSLAAAICQTQDISFADFCNTRLAQGVETTFGSSRSAPYDRTINALWRDSIALVAAESPFASDIAYLLSFLNQSVVDREWLSGSALVDRDDIETTLGLLADYSLVELSRNTVALKHNLIASGLAESANVVSVTPMLEGLFVGSVPEPAQDHETIQAAAEPIRHLKHLLATRSDVLTDALAPELVKAAKQLTLQGERSLAFYSQLVEHLTTRFGLNDRLVIAAMAEQTEALRQSSNVDEAVRSGQQVVERLEQVVDPDDPDLLLARHTLAACYWQSGNTRGAIDLNQEVLLARERILGADHSETLKTKNNLAACFWQAGMVQEAADTFEQLLEYRSRTLGEQDPETLLTRHNLATVYVLAGRPDEAIQILIGLIERRELALGRDHPDVLGSRAALASSYVAAGRSEEAIEVGETALSDLVRVLGVDHHSTAETQCVLALAYARRGQLALACEQGEDALSVLKEQLGDSHPHTLLASSQLGEIWRIAGHRGRASEALGSVLRLQAEAFGESHPYTEQTKARLEATI